MPQQIVVSARSGKLAARQWSALIVKHFVGRRKSAYWRPITLLSSNVLKIGVRTARRRVPRCQTHVRR